MNSAATGPTGASLVNIRLLLLQHQLFMLKFSIGGGYETTHGSSCFKTYSTIQPSMTQFKQNSRFVIQSALIWKPSGQVPSLPCQWLRVRCGFLVDASFAKMVWWKMQLCSSHFRKKTIKVWNLKSFCWKSPQKISKYGYNQSWTVASY